MLVSIEKPASNSLRYAVIISHGKVITLCGGTVTRVF